MPEKKATTPKKPKELKAPKGKNEITVDFINEYFRYQERLARYNYRVNKNEETKAKINAAKKEHEKWLSFVEDTYNGKVEKKKTDIIIKQFIDTYYPDIPDNVVRGQFK